LEAPVAAGIERPVGSFSTRIGVEVEGGGGLGGRWEGRSTAGLGCRSGASASAWVSWVSVGMVAKACTSMHECGCEMGAVQLLCRKKIVDWETQGVDQINSYRCVLADGTEAKRDGGVAGQ